MDCCFQLRLHAYYIMPDKRQHKVQCYGVKENTLNKDGGVIKHRGLVFSKRDMAIQTLADLASDLGEQKNPNSCIMEHVVNTLEDNLSWELKMDTICNAMSCIINLLKNALMHKNYILMLKRQHFVVFNLTCLFHRENI